MSNWFQFLEKFDDFLFLITPPNLSNLTLRNNLGKQEDIIMSCFYVVEHVFGFSIFNLEFGKFQIRKIL